MSNLFNSMTLIFPLDVPISCMEMHHHHHHHLNHHQVQTNNQLLQQQQQNGQSSTHHSQLYHSLLDGEVLDRMEKEYQNKIYNIRIGLDTPPDLLANIKFHHQQQQQHFATNQTSTINGNFQQESDDEVMLDDDDEYESNSSHSSDDDFMSHLNPMNHDMNTSIYISNNGNNSNFLNQGLLTSPNTQYIHYIDEDEDDELEDGSAILNISRISPPQSPPDL